MKKLVSMALVIVICISSCIISTNVYATDDNKAGNNITWNFDVYNCVLTLSGSGQMTDFAFGQVPWEGYKNYIKKVEVGEGITSIGKYAFHKCEALEEVTLPSTLKSIGWDSFASCKKIDTIDIPDSVTTISEWAFSYCDNLTKVHLPTSITYIDNFVFEYCNNLTEINIPDKVTSIGSFAFGNCSNLSIELPASLNTIKEWAFDEGITNISVDSNNNVFSSYDGILYSKNKETLLIYPCMKEGKIFTIPEGVKRIANKAFYHNSYIEEFNISDGVEFIDDSACMSMKSLKELSVSGTVKILGEQSFSGCSVLEKVTIEAGVKEIKSKAFLQCVNLKEIIVPSSVETIEEKAIGYEDKYDREHNRHDFIVVETTLIKCEKGSAAETYAKENGVKYEVPKIITIQFENTVGWESVYFYSWKMNGSSQESFAWPGKKLEPTGTSDTGNSMYTITMLEDRDNLNYIIFNNGKDEQTYDDMIPEGYSDLIYVPNRISATSKKFNGVFYSINGENFEEIKETAILGSHEYIYEDEKNDDYSVKSITISVKQTDGIMGYCFGTNSTISGDSRYINNPYYPVEGYPKDFSVTIPIDTDGDYYYCVISKNGGCKQGYFKVRKVKFFNQALDSEPYAVKLYPIDKEVKIFVWGSNQNQYICGYSVLPTVQEPEYIAGNYYKFTGNINLYAIWKDKIEQHISVNKNEYFKECGDGKFNLNASVDSGLNLEYKSNNEKVAIVDQNGNVTIIGEGKCKIEIIATGTNVGDPQFLSASTTVSINVTKKDHKIIIAKTKYKKTYGSKAFNLSAKSSSGIGLIYKSTNTKVVKVSSKGKVTITGYGNATIKISTKDSNIYKKKTKNVSVCVVPKQVDRNSIKVSRNSSNHSITIKWKKDKTVSGYQVQISNNKKYKSAKNIKVIGNNKATAKKLKVGTIYHFRLRAYKTIKGKKQYGAWLEIHKVPAI